MPSQNGMVLAAAILSGALTGAAQAQSFNLTTQFSTRVNSAKSVWSYRMGDGGGHDGNYTLLTDVGTFSVARHGVGSTLKDWDTPGQPFDVPLFLDNKAKHGLTFSSNGEAIAIPGQTVLYHPAYGAPAVVGFLATAGGTATISYEFTHLDWSCGTSGQGIDWSIEKNSGAGALASGHLYSPAKRKIDSTGTQQVSVAVAKGDRINFIVDGVANPPNCGSTGLVVTVALN